MTDADFTTIVGTMLQDIRSRTPIRTGNLKLNATRMEALEQGKFRIYVDARGDTKSQNENGLAPYFYFVNYLETLGKNQKKNRNYHYWDNAIAIEVVKIAESLGGKVI